MNTYHLIWERKETKLAEQQVKQQNIAILKIWLSHSPLINCCIKILPSVQLTSINCCQILSFCRNQDPERSVQVTFLHGLSLGLSGKISATLLYVLNMVERFPIPSETTSISS